MPRALGITDVHRDANVAELALPIGAAGAAMPAFARPNRCDGYGRRILDFRELPQDGIVFEQLVR